MYKRQPIGIDRKGKELSGGIEQSSGTHQVKKFFFQGFTAVSYTHLRAHETVLDLVCRLLLEKKKHIHINTLLKTHIK